MLAAFADLLAEHDRRGSALGAFTCYNFETAAGVLRAARTADVGVVLLVAESSLRAPDGASLTAGLRAAAERSGARACVQLDHVDDLELVAAALELGCGAVMADGSRLPLDDNAAFVRAAADLARRHGAAVEAELGRVEGDEDVATAATAGALTDPQQAAAFARRSGAACLAVSIGNVHGTYARPPALDWARLAAVRARSDVPLSLHGASGLGERDLARAISGGIRKVNVNTELRQRYLAETERRLPEVRAGARVQALNRSVAEAVAEVAAAKLAAYGGVGGGPRAPAAAARSDDGQERLA